MTKNVINPLDYKFTIGFEEFNDTLKEYQLYTVGFHVPKTSYVMSKFTIEKGMTKKTIFYKEENRSNMWFDLTRDQIASDIRFQHMSKKDKERLKDCKIIELDLLPTKEISNNSLKLIS